MKRLAFLLPFAVFATFAILLYAGLERGPPGHLRSPLIGKPAPDFVLAALDARTRGVARSDLAGNLTVVNFWASWCAPCRLEHPMLQALRNERIRLYGIVYKDEPGKARAFLDELGDPFDRVGVDPRGRTGIDFGITGVPETFVVDGTGTVRAHISGPLTPEILKTVIWPALGRR